MHDLLYWNSGVRLMMARIDFIVTVVVFIVALLVYVNTFDASFAFDDNFAIVYNGDVTNDANSVFGLFQHDFWGQNINSEMSHKSYRPLTVLSFRMMRQAWQYLPENYRQRWTEWRKVREAVFRHDQGSQVDAKLDPLLFHAGNALMHAVVSALFVRLSYYMFGRRLALLKTPSPPSLQPAFQRNRSPTEIERLILVHRQKMAALRQPPAVGGAADSATTGSRQPETISDSATASSSCRRPSATARQALAPGQRTAPEAGFTALASGPEAVQAQLHGLSAALHKRWQAEEVQLEQLHHVGVGVGSTGVSTAHIAPSVCANAGSAAEHSAQVALHWTPCQLWVHLHFPALMSSLAFALHPAHTEAVAGIVGHAETLSASFAIVSLLLYISAVDGCGPTFPSIAISTHARAPITLARHWAQVAVAVVLCWAAALSKEIGITVIGTAMVYDGLLVPWHSGMQERGRGGERAASGGDGASGAGTWQGRRVNWLKWARLVTLAAAGMIYVKLRGFLAVDQLVRIFRKVENPIPFSSSAVSRLLTTGFLHARYFAILVWPQHLSADWSFACIPMLDEWRDPRNALTAALYTYLIGTLLMARPWRLPMEVFCRCTEPAPAVLASRWRLMVLVGLCVGPLFPASNVLFYVGTFIGERLLYFPSVGYCLLLSELAGTVLGWATATTAIPITAAAAAALVDVPTAAAVPLSSSVHARSAEASTTQSNPIKSAAHKVDTPSTSEARSSGGAKTLAPRDQQPPRSGAPHAVAKWQCQDNRPWSLAACVVYLAVVALLAYYARRTWLRNYDWASEDALFIAAQGVCNNSAKVQLNSGVLERRRVDLPKSLGHFRRAREIEPGYCEPDYWVGITLVNQGNVEDGLAELESALSCKYVAAEAMKALNKIYAVMHQGQGGATNPQALMRWGGILLRPEVRRLGEGCDTLEQAALAFSTGGTASATASARGALVNCMTTCASALRSERDGTGLPVVGFRVMAPLEAAGSADQMLSCLESRQPVYEALARYGTVSEEARWALYKYVRSLLPKKAILTSLPWAPHRCRDSRAGSGTAEEQAAQVNTPHLHLVHRIHSAYADDPWLQIEWAETMVASGGSRRTDAATHLSVAGMLFVRYYQALTGSLAGQPSPRLTSLDGKKLTATAALEAATAAMDRSAAMYHAIQQVAKGCEVQLQSIEVRLLAAAAAMGTKHQEAANQDFLGSADSMRRKQACQAQRLNVDELERRFRHSVMSSA